MLTYLVSSDSRQAGRQDPWKDILSVRITGDLSQVTVEGAGTLLRCGDGHQQGQHQEVGHHRVQCILLDWS